MSKQKKPEFFYGYVVVGAGLVTQVLILGTYSSFGVFFKPLAMEFGWMRATTSAAVSIAALVMGFSAIATGRLTDKYGPKVVLMASGLFVGVGYLLMSRINALWQLYLTYGLLVGIAMSAADLPITSTVARWFIKRRGMMTGVTKAGAGIGIMVVPLVANLLITNYGWRNAYIIIGITALIGIILAALFLKRDPAQIGKLPDGATESEVVERKINPVQFSLREAMGTSQLRLLLVIWFSFMSCANVIILHTVPHITDLGFSPALAASVISVIGGFSIFGRLSLPSLSDSLGTKKAYQIAFSLLAISLIWLQFAREAWMFYLFAAVYGTAHGASYTLLAPMVAGLFGLRSLGTILGVVLLAGTFGSFINPILAGRIYDTLGSYQLAFLILTVLSLTALTLVSLIKPMRSPRP